MLLEPELLSPTIELFNCLIWGIMSIINSLPINPNNDDEHYEALFDRQTRNGKNYVTSRSYDSLPIKSTVAVQWEDGGLDHNHNNRWSYMIRITKTLWEVMRNSKHIKATPITAKNTSGTSYQKYSKLCGWHTKALWKASSWECDDQSWQTRKN